MRAFRSGVVAPPQLGVRVFVSHWTTTPPPAMLLLTIAVVALTLMLLLLLLFLCLWAFKPWRHLSSPIRSSVKDGDLERPLIYEDLNRVESQSDELAQNIDLEAAIIHVGEHISSSGSHGLVCKHRLPSADAHVIQGASLVLDEISNPSEDSLVGQTLKRSAVTNYWLEETRNSRKEESDHESSVHLNDDHKETVSKEIPYQRSSLTLEVISGPSRGLLSSLQSTDTSRLPLTLGRVSPSNLVLKDGEISGKHATINWNMNNLKWELVDMGSLNGTLLNSLAVHNPDTGTRHWSKPVELSDGDVITLGTTSKIKVQITQAENQVPFGVGMASDPMALRRGGKKLPMEDVCYYQWPLPGVEQFGLFGICDGHGGRGAAKTASKMLPEIIASILSVSENRERVLSHSDASGVLRDAFIQTESAMHHQYEGCTATVLLVWAYGQEDFFVQCANVGDSACLMNVCGKQIKMTEDHRITSHSERIRLNATGVPLKDGETRLCGLNLARMLGDKFLKEQDPRFSSEPYISQVVHIDKESKAFALMASDGLWDVISVKKAMQLAVETRDKYATDKGNMAEKIANVILSEARTLRTKDNTSIIFLDFDSSSRTNFL